MFKTCYVVLFVAFHYSCLLASSVTISIFSIASQEEEDDDEESKVRIRG